MISYQNLKNCLCCDSSDLRLILDLADQPLANRYANSPEEKAVEYPLQLNLCQACFHSQLSISVDRRQIFEDYAYVSGTSQTLNQYFEWFAEAISKIKPKNSKILEIAANDGSLIKKLTRRGFVCTGVDPAQNIVEAAQKNNIPIHLGYWPEFAKSLYDKFDVIIAMNVLAHVPNPFSFLEACSEKLSHDGLIIIQPSQARMFENAEFDTIYHEHISFFNTNSISKLAERCGLYLSGTAIVKVHGDSPIYFLKKIGISSDNLSYSAFYSKEFGCSENLISYEEKIGLYDHATYDRFALTAKNTLHELVTLINKYKNQKYIICFVGAAAKAMTVLNASKITPDYILDESPLKIGHYAPGCSVKVSPLAIAKEFSEPTLFILSAWNFKVELTSKLKEIGVPEKSKFYTYFPSPELFD